VDKQAKGEIVPSDKQGQFRQLQMVWRCLEAADEASSVCCRLKSSKHKCLCGHKLQEHASGKCRKCACATFRWHIVKSAWEARCQCKHKAADHKLVAVKNKRTGETEQRFVCAKHVPGKRHEKCPCDEEAINTLFCPPQEKFHSLVLRRVRTISEAP
jgi:hypothetical protein